MRPEKHFRPVVGDRLEDRTVPSGFWGVFVQSVPAIDAQKVAQAFETFEQSYANDVRTILYAPGTTNPSSNQAAFNTKLTGTEFPALTSAITTATSNLATANPTLGTTLNTAVNNLQTSLTGATNIPTTANRFQEFMFLWSEEGAIDQTARSAIQSVRNATPPAGTITSATAQSILSAVNTAFQNFTTGFFNGVSQSPPVNNTSTLFPTLQTAVTSAINGASPALPSSVASSLTASSSQLNTDLNALQTSLTGLTLPTSGKGFAAWMFDWNVYRTISRAQSKVTQDILSAINTYNTSL
jgi:hypothetical protein